MVLGGTAAIFCGNCLLQKGTRSMWCVTILALGAAASPGGLEAAAGFEAVASKLAGKPSKLPDVVKSRLKLIKLHCAVLTHSRGVGCTYGAHA